MKRISFFLLGLLALVSCDPNNGDPGSEFEGLVREHYAVTFEKDRVYIDKIDVDVLYKYDCGIQF